MITVEHALSQVLNLVDPLDIEMVGLDQAAGRILARDAVACRDQPAIYIICNGWICC